MKNEIKWGTKVVTTELAIKKNIFPQHRRGICLGVSMGKYRPLCLVVVCKGQKTPRTYHPAFWEKV
ncbi:hypothetical protein LCGC14_0684480 [marine sediment metagenome]|uniref:Uncharacterized protein n=1 Tax=marine sediment metagenome TaxID=412755 RepID=A0A0F9QMD7_9ZZZZ